MWGSYLACEKYTMPAAWSPGSRMWWQSLKCCEISQFFLKCYPHLLLQGGRGSNTHSDVPVLFFFSLLQCDVISVRCLTHNSSLPRTLCALTTQLTDLAHFSTKTTSRCRRTPSSIGCSSTITSTWKALQKNMEKSFWKKLRSGLATVPHVSVRLLKMLDVFLDRHYTPVAVEWDKAQRESQDFPDL